MKKLPVHLRNSQVFRYIYVGGLSYVIELAALLSLTSLLFLSPELSVACSFWIGLVASFLLQKYIAFSSRESDKKTIGRQTLAYGALVLFNYLFTIVFVGLSHAIFGLVAARTLALLCTVLWNYFLYKRIFGNAAISS